MTDLSTIPYVIQGSAETSAPDRAPISDPAMGEIVRYVALGGPAEVERAVAAEAQAAPAWAATPPHAWARIMFRFRELVERDIARLAKVITAEHGKLLSDARGEIQRGLEVVEFASGIPQQLNGDYSEQVGTTIDAVSFRQPFGVVAGMTAEFTVLTLG